MFFLYLIMEYQLDGVSFSLGLVNGDFCENGIIAQAQLAQRTEIMFPDVGNPFFFDGFFNNKGCIVDNPHKLPVLKEKGGL